MPKRVLALAGALVLLALPAFAQTNPTGTISGRIADQQGLAVPGASVTVQSPALQGARTATTSANGDYILPFLPVADDYVVTVEMSGFKAMKQSARVTMGQTTTVNVTLAVSAVTETVEVIAGMPADFGQKAQVATNFKQELIERLPLGRTFEAAALLTPGVQSTGPQGAMAISGAMSYQNVFMINGVTVQDNVRSTPYALYIEDALQETTTMTAAVSAEYGRFGGGVVNAITKSGGNQLKGSYRMTLENDKWTALTPYPNDSRNDALIPTHELTLGGPILKDKLWFFGATRLRTATTSATTSSTLLKFDQVRDQKRFEGKLTFSPSAQHTFRGAYSWIKDKQDGNFYGAIMDLASLVNRTTPQTLLSLNYTGIVKSNFFVEAQYASRTFRFVNSGSQFTDPIKGTLLLDRSRGSNRYNSPTFCGVCGPEGRDNQNVVVKASYFASTKTTGSHNLVGGIDMFDDKRKVNNHQSGSDFRVYTTSAILNADGTIYPVLDSKSYIRWTPIFEESKGNRFRTWSAFLNDTWTLNRNFTFNVGLRYDKNDGVDASGNKVVKDAAFSPRLSVSFDPRGDTSWSVNASYAKYVTAIANTIGDSAAAGGQPATIDFDYLGPAVNTGNPANPLTTEQALTILWDWFNANGGTNRPIRGTPSVPGVNYKIGDRLASPNVQELTLGFTRRLGSRGLVRVDGVYRTFGDFYALQVDLGTGQVKDQYGRSFDMGVYGNTNALERKYKGLNLLLEYRPAAKLLVGGNYTLSKTEGSFDGESGASGPGASGIESYPEYFDVAWNLSTGGLATDVRHRARLYSIYTLPLPSVIGSFDLGAIYYYTTGTPYGSAGAVATQPYVTNPGYATPPATVNYWFEPRDTYRMADLHRFDLSINWSRRVGLRDAEVFFRARLLNAFNRDALTDFVNASCSTSGCVYTTILTNDNDKSLATFNPFTTTPVEGTNWKKQTGASGFGMPRSRYAYQTPRTYDFSFGVRF